MTLAFQFLGPPQLLLENAAISVNRRSILALLAYLAVNDSGQANRVYTREALSALLWPDYHQVKAFTNLRHTLWEIQKTLGPGWLVADRETIGLRTDANVRVDVHQFESLLSESRTQREVSRRVPLLTESVKLYRHHFLGGFTLKSAPTFDEWVLGKSNQLQHKFSEALTILAEDHCLLGDAESALPYARRLVTLDPVNESAQRLLMQVYVRVGQHHAALKQYLNFEQILRKELGLDPQPEIRALYKQIRKGAVTSVPTDLPREPITPQNNLPQLLTSFIGRTEQQAEIVSLLTKNRLITLAGSGGIGKTRLSLQVASKVLQQFPDGVWFIELAPLTNPDLIPQTILSTLHLGEQVGKTPLLVLEEQLIHKKVLLILDNCEHLIADSARVAHALLKATAEVKILVTSREVLSIGGEIAWRVPSLAFPDSRSAPDQLTNYEAVRLFVDRALSVQPHLKLDEASLVAVAHICSRLDGIPLAIELAAARVNALGVKQIAQRLDDRFRLLTKGSRIVLERHQTLRAAIDWSYNLLDTDETRLLARLAVFMGGWTIEAAEQICVKQSGEFEVLDVLSDLIDKSLVIMDGSTGEARYHLLETTRQYALEKLVESAEDKLWRDQHLAYFLVLAEQGHREITGPRQAEVINLLDAELDNFRAALDWCVSNQSIEPALQMLGALGWAWDMRGYYNEVRSWFEKIRVRENCANYPEAYARLLNHLGRFAADFDHRPDAESILEESRAIWLKVGTPGEQGLAEVLCFLGMNANNKGNLDRAESFYQEGLAVAQRCNHQRILAGTTLFQADIEYQRGNFSRAMDLCQQSLEVAQGAGDLLLISLACLYLGGLLVQQGSSEKARPLMERSLEINEKLQFRFGLAGTWINLAEYYRYTGNYVQAAHCIEKSMSISRDLGLKGRISLNLYLFGMLALHQNRYSSAAERFIEYFDFDRVPEESVSLCNFLTAMSSVAAGTGDSERCAQLFGAAQAALDRFPDFRMDPFDRAEFDRHIQIARNQLSRTRFDALSKEGRTISIEQAIRMAAETKID